MTEQQREQLLRAKAEVSQWLADEAIDRYRLGEIDPRIVDYIRAVADHPEAHNVFEQLAVRRFLMMCRRYGVNASAVWHIFTLYESLYFPGKGGKQRYKLTPVQCFQFAAIYGFWKDGRRVVREVALYVPRKFSKTTSSAAFIVDDLLYGDANAEAYTGANSQDQAKKCFDVIRGCIQQLDPKGLRYTVNEQLIKSRRKDRSAFAQCLTSNARTKDGLNASTIVMDEFSQARDANLLAVLTTSMGVRDNPLTVIITTASAEFDGPFYSMLQGYKSVLLGEFEDDSVFAHIFEPDLDDDEGAESTWLKVHPHIGVTVSLDFYRAEYRAAQRNGADAMLAFRTKMLNIYAEDERRSWISSTLARSASRPVRLDRLKGRPRGYMAIDLSERGDFSAVSLGMYFEEQKQFLYHTAYFFPRGALPGHPNENLYRRWAQDGYLKLLDGDVIDYRGIVEYVVWVAQYVEILGIGYDPYKSLEVVNMLATVGGKNSVRPIRQTYGVFTAAVETFEHALITGHAFIDDNPINFYCFGNAVLDHDKLENCKPVKRTDSQRIDGVITILMCQRQFLDNND